MMKFVKVIMSVILVLILTACANSEPEDLSRPSDEELAELAYQAILPQIEEYRQQTGIADLDVDMRFKAIQSFREAERIGGKSGPLYQGSILYVVRDLLTSKTISDQLEAGIFDPEVIHTLSNIEFDYSGLEDLSTKYYRLYCYSAFIYPIVLDSRGNEYTINESVILKGNQIVNIADDADLAYDASVGQTLDEVLPPVSSSSSTGSCKYCHGTGFITYYRNAGTVFEEPELRICPDCGGDGILGN